MKKERRRSPRRPYRGFLLIEAPTLSRGFWWPATLIDISGSGLALQLPADRPDLSAGVPIHLSLVFRDRIRFERVPAILVRQQGDVCAVEFARWEDADRNRLSNVLRELDRQPGPRVAGGSAADRRRHRRKSVRGLRGSFPLRYEVEVLNMSASGLAIECRRPLEVGSAYQLVLPASRKTFEVRADVRWHRLARVERSGSGLLAVFRSGLDFANSLDEKSRQRLTLLKRRERADGERRLSKRFKVGLAGPATVTMRQSFSVLVLSLSGMLIETARPVDSGSLLDLKLVAGDRTLPVVGRVANVEPAGRGEGCQAGIAFDFLDQGTRRALENVTKSFFA